MSRAAQACGPKAHPLMHFIGAELDRQGKSWQSIARSSTGIDRSHLYHARKGMTHLRIDQLERVLKVLGYDIEVRRAANVQ